MIAKLEEEEKQREEEEAVEEGMFTLYTLSLCVFFFHIAFNLLLNGFSILAFVDFFSYSAISGWGFRSQN